MISSSDLLQGKILIVDDQEVNVLLLVRMLRGAGYVSVASTTDPREVCELHRKNRYDLILLDLQMPGMDGFQVMESLKEIETGGYLPVLVITAQPGHRLRALEAGARSKGNIYLALIIFRVKNTLRDFALQTQETLRMAPGRRYRSIRQSGNELAGSLLYHQSIPKEGEKMPEKKETIIELTEEQRDQLRQATGTEHQSIKVESMSTGSQLAPKTALRSKLAPKTAMKAKLAPKTAMKAKLAPKTAMKAKLAPKTAMKAKLAPKTAMKAKLAPKTAMKAKLAPKTAMKGKV